MLFYVKEYLCPTRLVIVLAKVILYPETEERLFAMESMNDTYFEQDHFTRCEITHDEMSRFYYCYLILC